MPVKESNKNQRRVERARYQDRKEFLLVLGVLVLWIGACWQLIRAALWGETYFPVRRHGGDIWLADDPIGFWLGVIVWTFLGPIFMIGTAVFMWIQRNDLP